jgi:PDZ domain-containing protein
VSGTPAVGRLDPDDIITAIDGKPVKTPGDVITVMAGHKPGDTVAFSIRRVGAARVVRVKTIPEPATDRAVVGITLRPAVDIHLPVDVRIDAGDVGGPSAGLAFALGILQELGRNIVRGHKIAATGEILPDGSVGSIGGVKQKTIGARQAHVDAFLVPAGDNAQEAKRYAHGLRIIAVKNFPQALRALATLR